MPDVFEEQAVLIAAEQAAAEGDAIAAEGHLRKLLFLQTARLGPEHQDVASTVHNLAVVCERAGRIGEAEFLFRRAYAVAAAVLPPTDQLVVRCQEDLNAFLGARVTAAQAGSADPAQAASAARSTPSSGVRKSSPSPPSRTPSRPASKVRPPAPAVPEPSRVVTRGTMAGIALAVLAALGIVWMVFGRNAARSAEPAPVAVAAAPVKRPALPPAKKPAAPATPPPAATAPASSTSALAASAPPVEPVRTESGSTAETALVESAPAATVGAIAVTDARLCGDLTTSGRWTCTAPGQPVAPGRLAFLTRLAVPSTIQVEHRWYYGSELIRSVSLRVAPAGTAGYRTYSRQVIDRARTGEWRVELRAPDGTVLAEERFTVQ